MSRASLQSYLAQQKHWWSVSLNGPNAIIAIFLAVDHEMKPKHHKRVNWLLASQISAVAPVHALYGFCAKILHSSNLKPSQTCHARWEAALWSDPCNPAAPLAGSCSGEPESSVSVKPASSKFPETTAPPVLAGGVGCARASSSWRRSFFKSCAQFITLRRIRWPSINSSRVTFNLSKRPSTSWILSSTSSKVHVASIVKQASHVTCSRRLNFCPTSIVTAAEVTLKVKRSCAETTAAKQRSLWSIPFSAAWRLNLITPVCVCVWLHVDRSKSVCQTNWNHPTATNPNTKVRHKQQGRYKKTQKTKKHNQATAKQHQVLRVLSVWSLAKECPNGGF